MDESSSESEADAPADDDDDIPYPLEGKFKDEADKARIQSLPQLEQEKILFERAEDYTRRQQQIQLRQKIKEQEREKERLEGRNKRKAATADLDDESRRATRPKTKRDEVMENYKRSRENNRRRDAARRLRTSRSRSPDSSDKDAEGESEVEWDDRPRTTGGARDEPLAEMRDIEHVRVGRSRFAECCFYPGFEDTITGCFVRVCVGTDRDSRPLYRMAMIKGTDFFEDKFEPTPLTVSQVSPRESHTRSKVRTVRS
jgi:RNA polymerase-associated protein RTF1